MNALLRGYIEAALWSSNDWSDGSGGEPLDANYSASDLAPETLKKMTADCARFESDNAATIDALLSDDGTRWPKRDSSYPIAPKSWELETIGHDFWLTRNGHGCGFWDGDYPEPAATVLTDASKKFGEIDLYVGDDGRIYQ